MKKIFLACTLFFAVAAQAAPARDGELQFSSEKIHARWLWVGESPRVGAESILRIDFKSNDPVESVAPKSQVSISLWMPAMNHGSAPTSVQRILNERNEVIPGAFHVSNIHFTMGGTWEVRVSLKSADGKIETRSFALTLEGDGHHGR